MGMSLRGSFYTPKLESWPLTLGVSIWLNSPGAGSGQQDPRTKPRQVLRSRHWCRSPLWLTLRHIAMSNSTISWKPDPDFRGTFNILSTCLSTLFICVWSAVHDDIPTGLQGFKPTLRRLKWLVVGLFAPELLLYLSFQQWWAAKELLIEVERAFDMKSPPPSWCVVVRYSMVSTMLTVRGADGRLLARLNLA